MQIFLKRSNQLLIILLATILTLPWIFFRPFQTNGEPREALSAQAMIRESEWILPKRYGNEYPTKPPLMHWMIALMSQFKGQVTEGTARLPSVLFSILSVAILFRWLKDNIQLATITSIILLTSVEWHRASTVSRVDMTLTGFLFLSLILIYKWSEKSYRGFPWLLNIMLSGASLTKGPVGILLPGFILTLYMFISRYSLKQIIPAGLKLLPALILPMIWYYLAYLKGGEAFLQIIKSENLDRFSGKMASDYGAHKHSAFYLYATILLGIVPWVLLLLSIFKKDCFSRLRFNLKYFVSTLKGLHSKEHFALIVIFSFIVFYSFAGSKRSVYLLPIYPFLSIFIAKLFLYLKDNQRSFLNKISFSFILFVLFSFVTIISFIFSSPELFAKNSDKIALIANLQNVLQDCINSGLLVFLPLIFGIAGIYFWFTNKEKILQVTLFTYLSLLISVNAIWLSKIAEAESLKTFSQMISTYQLPIYSFKNRFYSIDYYLNGIVKELEDIPEYKFGLLINTKDVESFKKLSSRNLQLLKTSDNLEKNKVLFFLVN